MDRGIGRRIEDIAYVMVLSALLIGVLVGIGVAGLAGWGMAP